MSLRILLVGNGGREHALAWKLSQSPLVESIIAVPGNGGTSTCPKTTNIDGKADDYPALVQLAKEHNVNLVVPGPEAPLVDGIQGYFRDAGIRCYGPSKEAARMEGSKTFSKDFMKKWNIPTAAYENFSDYEAAKKYLDSVDHNVVIKASGLAAGKGVIIPTTKEEAQSALKEIMLDREFGSAGDEVVIEEFLEGDELSILTFSDGQNIFSLPPAQDHKRIFDGDLGPNTGGMGCYAPTNIAPPSFIEEVTRTILQPTIDGMRKDRMRFVGTLFTGLMITKTGPKVLEYNVRFGDPETQTLLPLLESDLAEIMVACADGCLDALDIKVQQKFSATVVVAAGGYPGIYAKGTSMAVDKPGSSDIVHFHAGTDIKNGQLVTAGGRVIASTAAASGSLKEAVAKAYSGVELIQFEKMQYRKDIAHRAFKQQSSREALTYAGAGVSVDNGNTFVENIKASVRSTARAGADALIGGFGGEVNLDIAGYKGAPIMVGAIDGVGTKLVIAGIMNKHDTVGIDLVAMNVNDLVVQGAEPLMFLDYIGCSKLNLEQAAAFVKGVADGCKLAGCALSGGETAEMPGMYQGDDYDAAGAAIGAMYPKDRLPLKEAMVEGDVLIGLASAGVHSNGFSLVRRIVSREGIDYKSVAPWDSTQSVGESLLTPTRIYVQSCLKAVRLGLIKGLSHITGGGLTENIPRMLPDHLCAQVDVSAWTLPPVFKWLKDAGNVSGSELARTFNTGLGMVAVVSQENASAAIAEFEAAGEKVYRIGHLTKRSAEGCEITGVESWE